MSHNSNRISTKFSLLFQDDGHVEMHNIAAECMFRHIAMGRRNWMHMGSHGAAENISFVYSLLESRSWTTCRSATTSRTSARGWRAGRRTSTHCSRATTRTQNPPAQDRPWRRNQKIKTKNQYNRLRNLLKKQTDSSLGTYPTIEITKTLRHYVCVYICVQIMNA